MDAGGVVVIDPAMVQNLGMRTAPVTLGAFWRRVDGSGRVETDAHSLVAVTARADGWVEVLNARAAGEPVRRGAVLAEIYSPAIATAQAELLLALAARDTELVTAARRRLQAFDVDARAVAQIETSGTAPRRTAVIAPIDGYLMNLNVREGAAVTAGSPMFEISTHDDVWLIAEIPERESGWIGVGRPVEARFAAYPERVFEGSVDYLYPDIETATRTRRARIVLANRDGLLHPGMYADVTLFGGAQREQLLVPTEAVIRTGARTLVIVALGEGRFRPQPVRIGGERGGETIILDGLEVGQRVVTSGQFLIDSEASMRGIYRRIDGATP
jgi:Cu(I)/Ag(I) efflux system membrane fusion protein